MRQYQVIESKLQSIDVAVPIPQSHQLLIKAKTFGLNRADVLQIDGLYKGQSNVLGLEVAGYINGTEVKVCALIDGGGFSEYVVADKSLIIPLSSEADLIESAALPEALTTCWMSLFDLSIVKNSSILIHAGGSGIGAIAIQIAKHFGAKVFVTANIAKHDKLKEIGADECFEYNDFSKIKELGGVDIIIDVMGGKYFQQNLKILNKYGKLISLAVMDDRHTNIDLGRVLMKNLSIIGTTLRFKPLYIKEQYIQNVKEHFMPLINSEKIRPVIDSVFNFNDTNSAIERMRSREHIGKIIIKV